MELTIMTNYTGNITTMIKWISMPLAGATIGILTAHGLNLPVDQSALSEAIFTIIMLGVGILDSKYPNTFKFLNNHIEEIDPALEYDTIETNDAAGDEIEQ